MKKTTTIITKVTEEIVFRANVISLIFIILGCASATFVEKL